MECKNKISNNSWMIEIITIDTKNDIHYNFDNCNFDRSKIVLHFIFLFCESEGIPKFSIGF